MKSLTLTMLLIGCFALTGFSQDTTKTAKQAGQKSKATYQVGRTKITVWENQGKNGTWKSFKVEKIYKKDDKWASTNSFNETELLELKAALDKAISEENVKVKTNEE